MKKKKGTVIFLNKDKLRNIILECCNDVLFVYNGKKSGITSEVHDSVPTFQVWHGSNIKEYSDVDALMSDKFFGGKSVNELLDAVTFTFA